MDWIERAENWLKCDHRYAGAAELISQGIVEVLTLRKVRDELKERVKAEASRVGQYKDLISRLDDKIERLEKELGISQENAASYWDRMYRAEQKLGSLEKEKAELAELVGRYERQKFECLPETPTLRDEIALEFMARSGNSAMTAYKRADEMLTARQK